MKKKKLLIIAAISAMVISSFSGCGKKDVDINVDDKQDGSGESSDSRGSGEGLAGELGVPEEVDVTLLTGDSGLSNLSIKTDEVHMPDTDHMSVVYCKSDPMTPERRKEIVEMIFDKEEGIYVYDYEHRIKSEIEEEIEWCEKERESDSAQGYDISWYDEYIDELQQELATAPDEYPAAEAYTEESYIGTYNGRKYNLSVYDDGSVNLYMDEETMKYRPIDAEGVVNAYSTYEELEEMPDSNLCTISEDEAESLALNMLGELGINDVVKDRVYPLEWVYYDENGNDIQKDYDGYVFKFARSIDGGKATNIYVGNAMNLQQDNGWPQLPSEGYYVYVDANGVLQLDYQNCYTLTGEVETDVDLLSFDELIEKANTSVAQYYTDFPTDYANITFNGVYLTYCISVDENNKDQYKYIPVWIFTQYVEYQDQSWSEEYPDQVVMLDARDGSYIDLVQLSKDLGTFESFWDDEDVDYEDLDSSMIPKG